MKIWIYLKNWNEVYDGWLGYDDGIPIITSEAAGSRQ